MCLLVGMPIALFLLGFTLLNELQMNESSGWVKFERECVVGLERGRGR